MVDNIHGLFIYFLFINKSIDFTLIEDGLANYVKNNRGNVGFLKRLLLDADACDFGYNEKIKKIVLSGLSEIPGELKEKSHIIDIKYLWENISQDLKDCFLETLSDGIYSPLDKIVIFTQPFSEHGIMTEHEKIEMYRTIFHYYEAKYGKEDICIKTHPRETTLYENYFDCKVIHTSVPGQIMLLVDKPDIIATIYSSVGYTSLNIRNDIWGTEFSHTLINKVGRFPANFKPEGIKWSK
ncbi:UNVERIFIED_ORG: hypothetical protein J2Y78_003966 [Buttiauxella agrestis ATCC 33320]